MKDSPGSPKIFLVAGESSGDLLGASLMRVLKTHLDGQVQFAGVGGPVMIDIGMESLFPMEDLAVMGVFEVVPRLPVLLKRIKQTARAIEAYQPDVLVTIDAPDFCFRVIKKLKARGIKVPVIHYVAPSVWAWRPGRAKTVAGFLDHVLCLLPFEPAYFEKEGLKATFVGHPVVESDLGDGDGTAFRARHHLLGDTPLVCVLPGSRRGEVERLLPVFGAAVGKLTAQFPNLQVVIPTLAHLETRVQAVVQNWPAPVTIIRSHEKADAFAAAHAALAASGTVALELAMAKVPSVIGYKVNALTGFMAKCLLKTPYVNLINIILGREAVPELLQDNCTAENLAREVARLLDDPQARRGQQKSALEALKHLGLGGPDPGARAAQVVLGYIKDKDEDS